MVMDLSGAIVGRSAGDDCQMTFWPHQLLSNPICKATERLMVEDQVLRKDQNLFFKMFNFKCLYDIHKVSRDNYLQESRTQCTGLVMFVILAMNRVGDGWDHLRKK